MKVEVGSVTSELNDEYMWECAHCSLLKIRYPERTYAEFSRDRLVVRAGALKHFKETKHRVDVYLKKHLENFRC